MSKTYGIDLGTRALKIYKSGKGIVYDEKNTIAIADESRVIATGDAAFDMVGKAPSNISVTFPVRQGVLADIKDMSAILNIAFEKISENYGSMRGSDFIIASPTDITEVERKAFVDLIMSTNIKPKKCNIVDRPVADGLGAGIDITDPKGVLILDIGADTTELSVLSYGGIVLSKMMKFGGNQLDESIINAVRKTHSLVIGNKTAETIKIALATAVFPLTSEIEHIRVFGRDVVNGLPVEKKINSVFVYEVLQEQLETIVDSVKLILEKAPPELAADIMETGIYITGGSAKIRKLPELIHDFTHLKVHLVDDPANSVARGLGRIIDDSGLSRFGSRLQSPILKD